MKWITVTATHAPGRVYQSLHSQSKTYTQEDVYIRAWIPVVIKPKFALAIGPHYRSEQLELKTAGNDVANQLSKWQLRSWGVDMKSMIELNQNSWLINTASVSHSGNFNSPSQTMIPFSYTFSSTYLLKKSVDEEIGFGLMVNQTNKLMVLPVFVFNYNFSDRSGIEISLPHKIAWRQNLSKTDILYLKSEAVTRTYFIREDRGAKPEIFRRIDVDIGDAYNKQLRRFVGFEMFAGYRQNISYSLPVNITAVKNSGWAASFEIYVRPPQRLRR
ncbi:MAG: DUF6268 family outer membrane beta-barrel protein [Chryseolinea sp.]